MREAVELVEFLYENKLFFSLVGGNKGFDGTSLRSIVFKYIYSYVGLLRPILNF